MNIIQYSFVKQTIKITHLFILFGQESLFFKTTLHTLLTKSRVDNTFAKQEYQFVLVNILNCFTGISYCRTPRSLSFETFIYVMSWSFFYVLKHYIMKKQQSLKCKKAYLHTYLYIQNMKPISVSHRCIIYYLFSLT